MLTRFVIPLTFLASPRSPSQIPLKNSPKSLSPQLALRARFGRSFATLSLRASVSGKESSNETTQCALPESPDGVLA